MAEQKPWTLRYKQQQVMRQGTVMASTEALADAVGKAYCNLDATRRFIGVEDPVLADESILPKGVAPEEQLWDALTNLERLASMQGKTVEQVTAEIAAKRRQKVPANPALPEEQAALVEAGQKKAAAESATAGAAKK